MGTKPVVAPSEPAPAPSSPPLSSAELQLLLAAYEHCAADVRNYDSVSYQIPAISAAVMYAVTFVVFSTGFPWWLTPFCWLVASILLFSLAIGMYKHRCFQKSRVNDIREINRTLVAAGQKIYEVPISTDEVCARWKGFDSRLFRVRAANWLLGSMWVTFALSGILFFHSAGRLLHFALSRLGVL